MIMLDVHNKAIYEALCLRFEGAATKYVGYQNTTNNIYNFKKIFLAKSLKQRSL